MNLTVKQTAATLSISPERVRQLIYSRKLSAIKQGRDWLVDADSVTTRLIYMKERNK